VAGDDGSKPGRERVADQRLVDAFPFFGSDRADGKSACIYHTQLRQLENVTRCCIHVEADDPAGESLRDVLAAHGPNSLDPWSISSG